MAGRPSTFRVVAALSAVALVAACAAGPVSQATDLPTTPGLATPSASAGGDSPAPSASLPEPSAATPEPPASPAPATPGGPPPKPGDPTFTLIKETPRAGGGATQEYRITWTSPEGAATGFLVYGVTDCLRYSKQYQDKPCVVRGMKIPKANLVLLDKLPGDARSTTVSWDIDELGPGPYYAILLRASNSFGSSIFTIAYSDVVCFECVY